MKTVLLSDAIARAGEELLAQSANGHQRRLERLPPETDAATRMLRGERARNLVNPEVLSRACT